MQSKYLLHQDSDALLVALGPTHNTKSDEKRAPNPCAIDPALVFCHASRQWRRGNNHLNATPPVLDSLSPLGATSAAERSLEKSLLLSRKNTRCQLAGITHDTCAKPPVTGPSQLLQPILDGRNKAAATDKAASAR